MAPSEIATRGKQGRESCQCAHDGTQAPLKVIERAGAAPVLQPFIWFHYLLIIILLALSSLSTIAHGNYDWPDLPNVN